jgi:hypothetical protein
MRRPLVDVWGQRYEVIDVSEGGLRFQCPDLHGITAGQQVQAVITFADMGKAEVEGTVVRIEPRRVALQLSVGVPYSRIVREQLHLLSRAATRSR